MFRKEARGAHYDLNYHLAPRLEQASEAISRWTRSAECSARLARRLQATKTMLRVHVSGRTDSLHVSWYINDRYLYCVL